MNSQNPMNIIIDQFNRSLRDLVQRAVVESVDANQVYVFRDSQALRDPISYPTIDGLTVAADDEVLLLRVGSSYVVVGKIIRN